MTLKVNPPDPGSLRGARNLRNLPRLNFWAKMSLGDCLPRQILPLPYFGALSLDRISKALVAPAFRRALWIQARARLKAGAT
jgi:hypothetical protein